MLGMVGGVFLSYGLNAFTYAIQNVSVCAYMVGAFFVWYAIKPLARKVPPVFIAGVAGGIALKFLGGGAKAPIEWSVATPVFILPHFSFYSIFTLVIPLFLMVIGVQNIQAVGVLLARDYIPPINTIYTTPSIVTFFNAFMGAHTAVTAGPSTAIVSSEAAGKKEYRFIAAFFEGCWWVLIGLLGKVGVGLRKQVPAEFILTLAGLALFDVFIDTIHAAFSDKLKKGAMVAFLIAASNVSLFKIGAAFWAIVAGVIVSLALEWRDFGNTIIKNEQEPQTQHAK
jgi:benzoate membrane transport protein